MSASETAKQVKRKARSIAERFIVMKHQRAECLDEVDILNVQFMMLGPEMSGYSLSI